ncbi:serine/threonine protein phosphatase [Actinocatenispora thailandica]|uniref:Serine/threonine protein phosphatase n=1 Tax=Actinocatenispora thailandica TaxID=227318 RepID=A0A7R7DN83_9ACTN|nr:metallophosphoesterase [Actinocatenispora thailandica]BCJ34550.1 serine/threonine protein phosphatase [Actinocatenispora thailandica]
MPISSSVPSAPEPSASQPAAEPPGADPSTADSPADAALAGPPAGPLYVVGDVHGQYEPLLATLAGNGLVDADGHWSGGATRLWFLGDLTDRGPDGIGVIRLVRRLGGEAAAVGGRVDTLLGNHEILLLGSRRFGDELIDLPAGARSFHTTWQLNGGRDSDLDALTDDEAEWLTERPAMVRADDFLLAHSDTVAYLDYGDSVEQIVTALRTELVEGDAPRWWECFRQLTRRHDFRGEDGAARVGEVLGTLGGHQYVHGHSPIPEHLAVDPSEVTAPLRYANGRALSVDGGLFAGGPCLVTRLPYREDPR